MILTLLSCRQGQYGPLLQDFSTLTARENMKYQREFAVG